MSRIKTEMCKYQIRFTRGGIDAYAKHLGVDFETARSFLRRYIPELPRTFATRAQAEAIHDRLPPRFKAMTFVRPIRPVYF